MATNESTGDIIIKNLQLLKPMLGLPHFHCMYIRHYAAYMVLIYVCVNELSVLIKFHSAQDSAN